MPAELIASESATPRTKARRTVRIGKYKVLQHIATGGMGAIYRAVDTELDRPVALKVLARDLAAKPIARERFRREARSAARLRHANIVAIYDVGEDNGLHYLALEFVDGIDLLDYIGQQGKLEPEEARQILIQAARALEHAHKQGVVHRDIKPSNFLIVKADGKLSVKLTDMGLARFVRDDEFRLTEAGTTLGTVDYMSPEQARDGNSADIRSDIYSLGCTFHHMLAGAAPFAQGTVAQRISHHFETKPPDIRELNRNVPEGLALVLAKMLEKKPGERYQNPTELLKDLENPARVEARFHPGERRAVLEKLAGGEERKQAVIRTPPTDRTPRKSPDSHRGRGASGNERYFRDPAGTPAPAKPRRVALSKDDVARFLRKNWLRLASGVGVGLALTLILFQLFAHR